MSTSDGITTRNPMNDETIDLEYLVRPPIDSTTPAPLLILLHGYGSNEKDLFTIGNQVPNSWFVVSVRAPFAMSATQFKWYDGELKGDKIIIDLVTEKQSRIALLQFIDQFVLEHNVDTKKVVMAGFSQGAGLGLTLALTEPEKIHAAACFSGRVMDQVKPSIMPHEALQSKEVFIGHGTEDHRSPLINIKENKLWLEAFGMKVTFNTYKMGHSVVPQEIDDFVLWIKGL